MENPREGWHHIAVTKDSDKVVKLYVDGELKAQIQTTTRLTEMRNDGKLYIGQVGPL